MVDKLMIEDMLYNSPLSLLAIKDEQVIKYLNELIPYSTAFEIECKMVGEPDYDKYEEINLHNVIFKNIPDIMSVQNNISEQRYRLPNGLRGIICLYNISTQLKIHSLLNPLSSIHYHCDCTDCYTKIKPIIKQDKEWILSELDTWLGNDVARDRDIGYWFKCNDLQTIEYRLGEMTFDYKIILKRIIHCNQITKKYKDQLNVPEPTFKKIDSNKIINYLKSLNDNTTNNSLYSKLNNMSSELEELVKVEEKPKESIEFRNRLHRINKPSKIN